VREERLTHRLQGRHWPRACGVDPQHQVPPRYALSLLDLHCSTRAVVPLVLREPERAGYRVHRHLEADGDVSFARECRAPERNARGLLGQLDPKLKSVAP